MTPVHEFRSTTNDAIIYACGRCGGVYRDLENAERCCRCNWEDCPDVKMSITRPYCEPHYAESSARRIAERRAKYLALPVVNDKVDWSTVEMVYVDNRYHSGIVDVIDDLTYEGVDLADVEAHVCRRVTVDSPLLVNIATDHWAEQYEDGLPDGLPKAVEDALEVAQRVLDEHAIVTYEPITTSRIDLVALRAGWESK